MSETVKINLLLQAQGVKETVKETGQIAGNLDKATASANKYSAAMLSAAKATSTRSTPAGNPVTASMPMSSFPVSPSMAKAQPTGAISEQEYGKVRGAVGTGAAGRDFAKQAQGLGGVVALYATFAANIFAVGAAFRALSNAMDTTNLVKGLDQLGAATGTSLGSLSKRLVEATDGAISLREAMESTAKASSSGMSSDNILRMGKVAKQASQALGVDMADAVNRLTRGITKLEPELLDELGIFTRVDAATKEYAKSVGKSASAITDFEKRMAFANAVLEEGERKFSAIDFETNPYTKLLASLKDVAQVGLELVNKVLTPLVSFLAKSPTALAVALGAIGVTLLKQAMPALGQLRAGLRATADDALAAAERFKSSFGEDFVDKIQKQFKVPDLTAQVKKAQEAFDKVKLDKKFSKSVTDLDKDIYNEKALTDMLARKNATIETGMMKSKKASEAQIEAAKKEVAHITKAIELYKSKAALKAADDKTEGVANKAPSYFDTETVALRKYQALRTKVDSSNAIANAAQNAQVVGVRASWVLLNQEIQEKGIKGVSKYTTLLQGGFAAVSSRLMGVVSSLGQIGMIIGAGIAAFTMLDSAFSKNGKEVVEFSSAVTTINESLANLNRTLEDIAKKPFGSQFDTKSLLATATAINEISISVSGLISKLKDSDKAANGWDKFIDGIKTLWGGDLRSQFAKNISSTIFGTLEKLSDSPAAQKAKASIASILNIDANATQKEWQSAFDGIAKNEGKLRLVNDAMKELSMTTGISASKAKEFDDALKVSKEAYKTFTNQFAMSDPLAKLSQSLVASSITVSEALKDPEAALGRIVSIVGDAEKMALFSTEDQKQLLKYGDGLTELNKSFEKQKVAVKASKEEIYKLAQALEVSKKMGKLSTSTEVKDGTSALNSRKAQLEKEEAALTTTRVEIATLSSKFPNIASAQLIKGADMLSASIGAAMAKGSTAFAEAVFASVGDLPGIAKQREAIENRKLDSEGRLLKIQAELIRATMLNSYELRRSSLSEDESIAQSSIRESKGAPNPTVQAELSKAQKALADLDRQIAVIKVDPSQALAAIGKIKSEIASGNEGMKKDAVELFAFVSSLAGIGLQQQNLADQKKANAYKAIIDTIKAEYAESSKVIATQKESNAIKIESLNAQKQINGSLTEQQSLALKEAQMAEAGLASAEKQLAIASQLSVLEEAKKLGGAFAPTDKDYAARKALLETQQINEQKALTQKYDSISLNTAKEISAEQKRLVDNEQELVNIRKEGTDALRDAEDKLLDLNNATSKSLGLYTPEYQAQLDAQLAALKVTRQAERDEESLTTAHKIKLIALEREAEDRFKAGASSAVILEVWDKIAAEEEAYKKKLVAIDLLKNKELESISQIEEARKKQSGFDSLIESVKSLDAVWQGFGTSLADTITTFDALIKSQDKYTNSIKALEKAKDTEEDPKKKKGIIEDIDKVRRDSIKAEIAGYGKLAGASKKMFAEKTVAYKTLSAVEKAASVAKMALELKDLAMSLGIMTTKVTAEGATETSILGIKLASAPAKVAADSPGILSSFAQMGPVGYAMGAALVAMLLSMVGGGGGGSIPSLPAGVSAEDMQKTQGTGGVFGDSEAKSNSIANSLELIKETSVQGLEFTNKYIPYLEKINKGIEKVALGVYSVNGLRTGSISGTIEKSTSNPGFLGLFASSSSTSIVNSGIQLQGTFLDLATAGKGVVRAFETVQNTKTKSGFLGIGASSKTSINNNYSGLPKELLADISSIFANATGLFQEQAKTIMGMSAETVNTILAGVDVDKLASLRGLTGTALQEELSAVLSSILDDAATELFPKLIKFRKFGEGFSETVTRVVDSFDKVNLAFDSIGLATINLTEVASKATPEMYDLVAANEAAMNAAKVAIPKAITAQEEVNDHYRRTVVVNSTQIAAAELIATTATERYTASLNELNEANSGMTTNNYDISESLLEASGGLETFLEKIDEFSSRFLNDAERLDFVSEKVGTAMRALGSSILETTEAYTKVEYVGSATTPTSMKPGGSQDALWEEIITRNWNAHVARFGIGWDTFRTKESERQAAYQAMLAEYNSKNIATYTTFDKKVVETNGYAMEMFKTFSDGNNGIIDTKDEFKRLVQGINTTIPEGQALYVELMKIQSGFADVAEATETYYDLFFSEEEKRVKNITELQSNLNSTLPQEYAGLASSIIEALKDPNLTESGGVAIRAAFRSIVDTLDTSVRPEALAAKTALMLLSQSVYDLTEASEEAATAVNNINDILRSIQKIGEDINTTINDIRGKAQANLKASLTAFSSALIAAEEYYKGLIAKEKDLNTNINNLRKQAIDARNSVIDTIASIIQGLKDAKQTAIDTLDSLKQGLVNTIDSLKDASENALIGIVNTIDSLKDAANDALVGIVNTIDSLNKAITEADKGVTQAQKNITTGYINANERLISAQKAMADAQIETANTLKQAANNLFDTLRGFEENDVVSNYSSQKNAFESLASRALSGDMEAINNLSSASESFKEASINGASTSAQNNSDILRIKQVLGEVGDRFGGTITTSTDTEDALAKELAEATTEMSRWTAALEASGASMVAEEENLLEEYTNAIATLTDAQEQYAAILEATKDFDLAGITTDLYDWQQSIKDAKEAQDSYKAILEAAKVLDFTGITTDLYDWQQSIREAKEAQDSFKAMLEATKDIDLAGFGVDLYDWQQSVKDTITAQTNVTDSTNKLDAALKSLSTAGIVMPEVVDPLVSLATAIGEYELANANFLAVSGAAYVKMDTLVTDYDDLIKDVAQIAIDIDAAEIAIEAAKDEFAALKLDLDPVSTALGTLKTALTDLTEDQRIFDDVSAEEYLDPLKSLTAQYKEADDALKAFNIRVNSIDFSGVPDLDELGDLLDRLARESTTTVPDSANPVELKSYFDLYSDVAAIYEDETYGLTRDEFAKNHYELFGAAEQRIDPSTLREIGTSLSNPLAEAVESAYRAIGREGWQTDLNAPQDFSKVDVAGFVYWLDQLKSGTIAMADFQDTFLNAVVSYSGAGDYSNAIGLAQQILDSNIDLPEFAIGTNYVPKDMIAQIHEGEAIIPKAYNPNANRQSDTEVAMEIRALRKELADAQAINKAILQSIAVSSSGTNQTLIRVTPDGDAIATRTAT